MEALGGGGGVLSIPLIILKISHIPKINMGNIPKIQRALYPHIHKIDPNTPYPFKYLQKYPVSLFFCQYPCIPKTPSRATVWAINILYLSYNYTQKNNWRILKFFWLYNILENHFQSKLLYIW